MRARGATELAPPTTPRFPPPGSLSIAPRQRKLIFLGDSPRRRKVCWNGLPDADCLVRLPVRHFQPAAACFSSSSTDVIHGTIPPRGSLHRDRLDAPRRVLAFGLLRARFFRGICWSSV